MNNPSPEPVSTAEIADLLAWARTLTETAADPAQRAAYLHAKANLLARITDQHTAPLPFSDKETQ